MGEKIHLSDRQSEGIWIPAHLLKTKISLTFSEDKLAVPLTLSNVPRTFVGHTILLYPNTAHSYCGAWYPWAFEI